ncbi:MAG: hypothetical protein HC925_06225 [Coleofasciculaceae cyanobacterium SM2_3_26]|nr:hypothetical protein [Coleofasciculaceae cyanobacterium SM2_3_26]
MVSIIPLPACYVFNRRSLAEQQFVRVALLAMFSQWFDRQSPYAYPFVPPSPADTLKALEQAIAVHKERIQQYPEDGLDRASLAGLYLKLARTTGEESWYLLAEQEARQSLINLPFFNDGAILTLARVAEAKHDFATAIGLAEQASGVEALGIVVTSKLALGDVEAADTAAKALVNLTPTPGSFALRALTRWARGDRAAALQDFQQAIATEEPDDARGSAWVRTLLGRFYAEQGNLTLAGQLYREALNILPDYPLALLQLGELNTRLGRYRSAERWYAQLDNPLAWQGIARIRATRGNAAKAEVGWGRAESVLRQQIAGNALGHRRDLATLLLERGGY